MYLFQQQMLQSELDISEIYIPLCIYFNYKCIINDTDYHYLHSTMYLFQLLADLSAWREERRFTFHYVSISTFFLWMTFVL